MFSFFYITFASKRCLILIFSKKSIMVESFIVRNYMSYRDQVELSFLASKKEKASTLPPEWYQEIDGKRILRLLLCVGLNGTGKTKMIEALQYLRMLAIYKPQNLQIILHIGHFFWMKNQNMSLQNFR